MADREVLEGPDPKSKAGGTGPFVFQEWAQSDHIRLVKNANYWQTGQPYLDGIEYRILSDAQAMVAQLEAGAVDMILNPPWRDMGRLHGVGLDHRRGGLTERTAATFAYAMCVLLRQLLVEERLPASVPTGVRRQGLALARSVANSWPVHSVVGSRKTHARPRASPRRSPDFNSSSRHVAGGTNGGADHRGGFVVEKIIPQTWSIDESHSCRCWL
jgi:hypothetical protein